MSRKTDTELTARVTEGHQPRKDEIVKGYQVTQPVDLGNLQIPSNLATAAVTPETAGQPAPASAESKE